MCKVDIPYSNAFLNRTPTFEWYVVWCGSKNGYHEVMCSKGEWTVCSNYDNHSRLHSHIIGGDLYDQLMSMGIFTLIVKEIFTRASKL